MEQNRMAGFAKTARDAVADLEEPLKTEAFKIILQQLVNGGRATPVSRAKSRVERGRERRTASQEIGYRKKGTADSRSLDAESGR